MPLNGSAHTVGSKTFDPDSFLDNWPTGSFATDDDFRTSIIKAFGLPQDDDYVYHATASVTLAQVQAAIDAERQNGLHGWYIERSGETVEPIYPDPKDIDAYIDIFSPTTSTTKALAAFAANARKGTPRARAGAHLQALLHLPDPATGPRLPPKAKPPSFALPALRNPYLDVWAWSCRRLEWAGPTPDTTAITHSHPLLPVLFHHFGCACPSWDALRVVAQACGLPAGTGGGKSAGQPIRPVVEIGSGNGYWAALLRRQGLDVAAVDTGLSLWRTMWIGDTVAADGPTFLRRPPVGWRDRVGGPGSPRAVLLVVYPQVSGDLTARVLRAYAGDTIAVAGTQNGNRFTGFATETVEEWMARERKEFEKVVQIPLPSFAGKDDALFVFKRRSDAKG